MAHQDRSRSRTGHVDVRTELVMAPTSWSITVGVITTPTMRPDGLRHIGKTP